MFSRIPKALQLGELLISGCWELNPVNTHPKRVYYRYTTARSLVIIAKIAKK